MAKTNFPPQTLLHNVDGPAPLARLEDLEMRLAALLDKVAPPPRVEFITIPETAQLLQVSKTTVHAWINKGILAAHKIGNQTRLKRHEVEAALTSTQKRKGGRHE